MMSKITKMNSEKETLPKVRMPREPTESKLGYGAKMITGLLMEWGGCPRCGNSTNTGKLRQRTLQVRCLHAAAHT